MKVPFDCRDTLQIARRRLKGCGTVIRRMGDMRIYPYLRPLIFRLDAETAHRATIAALKWAPKRRPPRYPSSLTTSVAGLGFPSPVGLAAGFDKDAEVPAAMLGLGFGFVEVGTLTPLPQAGNPRPRLFRLAEDRAVINRMGFNNAGQAAALARLAKRDRSRGVVGVNIGANKDSADRIADYAAGVRTMAPVADYLTVNISSPNTPGLRDLQAGGELGELLAAVREARQPGGPPVFLKVAPDLDGGDHERIARAAHRPWRRRADRRQHHRLAPAARLALTPARAAGCPAPRSRRSRSTSCAGSAPSSASQLPLIAAGGIASADDAWAADPRRRQPRPALLGVGL